MNDIFGKVFAAILGVFTIYLLALNISQKHDNSTQTYVTDCVNEFVDEVRSTGHISARKYLNFIEALDRTNLRFEVEITHMSAKTGMVDDADITKGYLPYYENYYTDEICDVLFSDDTQSYYDSRSVYKLKKGDFIKIEVKNATPTLANKMLGFWLGNTRNNTIFISYGGYVGTDIQLWWIYRHRYSKGGVM